MPTNEIVIDDRTLVRFLTKTGYVTVAVRDEKLRISAEDFLVIEPLATNVVLASTQRRQVGDKCTSD